MTTLKELQKEQIPATAKAPSTATRKQEKLAQALRRNLQRRKQAAHNVSAK